MSGDTNVGSRDVTVQVADDLVGILDYLSRVCTAADGGNIHYLWDKTGALVLAAQRLQARLCARQSDGRRSKLFDDTLRLDGARLRELVTRDAGHYRAGRALYPVGGSLEAAGGALRRAASLLQVGVGCDELELTEEQADAVAAWLRPGLDAWRELVTMIRRCLQDAAAQPITGELSGLEYQELWARTVQACSTAVRRGVDMGGFLASALAAVAANVGGVEPVLAGRPGSWEADLVRRLINGTVPEGDAGALMYHRTEPVVVVLNVAQLFSDSRASRINPYDEEADAIWADYYDVPDDADAEEEDPYAGAQEEERMLRQEWARRFREYAAAFTAAVAAEAALIPGLTAPVTVEAITNVEGDGAENPTEGDSDPLVWRLWNAARNRCSAELVG